MSSPTHDSDAHQSYEELRRSLREKGDEIFRLMVTAYADCRNEMEGQKRHARKISKKFAKDIDETIGELKANYDLCVTFRDQFLALMKEIDQKYRREHATLSKNLADIERTKPLAVTTDDPLLTGIAANNAAIHEGLASLTRQQQAILAAAHALPPASNLVLLTFLVGCLTLLIRQGGNTYSDMAVKELRGALADVAELGDLSKVLSLIKRILAVVRSRQRLAEDGARSMAHFDAVVQRMRGWRELCLMVARNDPGYEEFARKLFLGLPSEAESGGDNA